MTKLRNLKITVADCNEEGLVLENESIFPWSEIGTFGKCEYPGRELTWSLYYLQKKNDPKNIWIPSLGRFPLFRNDAREKRERYLKSKIIRYTKNVPHLRFVIKVTHFGKERPWNIEEEQARDRYWDSPAAEQAHR